MKRKCKKYEIKTKKNLLKSENEKNEGSKNFFKSKKSKKPSVLLRKKKSVSLLNRKRSKFGLNKQNNTGKSKKKLNN